MVQISTNPRKRRRFLENEAYAKDARFWMGKIRSADRIGHSQPTNAQALRMLAKAAPVRHEKIIVYLAKVTSKEGAFIKVGVSRNPSRRFRFDAFDVEIVTQTRPLHHGKAYAVEASVLEFMRTQKWRPLQLLKSGNTECLIFSSENLKKISDILNSLA